MTTAAARPRTRAPISIQLVALLLASLVAAQVISFAIIIFMPPPRPEVYRLTDVAAALRGGPLKARFGREMTRATASELPPDLREPRAATDRTARALAATLQLPEARVRIMQHNPSPVWRLMRRFRRDARRFEGYPPGGSFFAREERFAGPGDPPPPGESGRPPRGPGRRGFGPGFGPGGGPELAVFGDFTAALQQDRGSWVVVRSTPEPFPTDWQGRASLWLLAGFLLVAPAGYLFARRITAPLKRFAEAAETLGRDPLGPQMVLKGPAEVGTAAQAFNEMQARLKRYISDRTAMVGAISHDLRTPLARIKFKIEAAPAPLRDSVLADIDQMEQMIAGVLAFIRNEAEPRRRERLDLLSLVECVADDAAMLGGDVEILEGRPVTVEGDALALQRLFGNLVDNAVKYGGEARIQVLRDGDKAVVSIADRGAGLSADELELVFQPFYRTDASRNLDKAGVGLGLPIARASARAHGGEVELTSSPQGSVAVITLPAAS